MTLTPLRARSEGLWTFAGLAVGAHWRQAYLIGVIPALLVAWVIASVKEPESWKRAGAKACAPSFFGDRAA